MKKITDYLEQSGKWIPIGLFLIAAIFRFAYLGLRPFDGDEGVVIKMAKASNLKDLFAAVSNDVHPPLYHLFEFLSLKVLPFNELDARMVSALCGALTIVAVYFVFKKLFNKKIGAVVALLSIFNPVLAYHAAEVRPYSLLALIFFVQLYYFLKLIEERKWLSTALFSTLSLLLVLTQYIGLILVFGEILYLLILKRKYFLRTLAASLVAGLVFIAIWGKEFFLQVAGRSGEQSQALNLKANVTGLVNALYRLGAGRLFLDLDPSLSKNLTFLKTQPLMFLIFVLSLLLPIALFVYGLVVLYRRKKDVFYLMIIILAPLILAALLSSEIGPRAVRYLSFLAPVYLVAILLALGTIKNKTVLYFSAAIFLAVYLGAFVNQLYFERLKPGTNKIAQYLVNNAEPGDSLIIQGGYGGGEELVARYYLGNFANDLKIYDIYGDYKVGNLDEIKARDIADYITEAKSDSPTVWFYDFTYSDEDAALGEKIYLGYDKENQPLILQKIQ